MPPRIKTPKLSAEQQALIVKWLGLVGYVMRKRPGCWSLLDANEAYSVGTDALIRASQLFDPTNGAAFNTYAAASIYKQLWRENERAGVIRRKSGPKYGAPPIKCYSLDSIDTKGLAVKAANGDAGIDAREQVQMALAFLPPRYRTVVEMHLNGSTLSEIGQALGISGEGARQIKNKAIAKIASRLSYPGSEDR